MSERERELWMESEQRETCIILLQFVNVASCTGVHHAGDVIVSQSFRHCVNIDFFTLRRRVSPLDTPTTSMFCIAHRINFRQERLHICIDKSIQWFITE